MTEMFLGMLSFVLLAAAAGVGIWLGRRYEQQVWARREQELRSQMQRQLRELIPEGMTAEQIKAERDSLKAEQSAYRAMMNFSAEEAYRNAGYNRGDN